MIAASKSKDQNKFVEILQKLGESDLDEDEIKNEMYDKYIYKILFRDPRNDSFLKDFGEEVKISFAFFLQTHLNKFISDHHNKREKTRDYFRYFVIFKILFQLSKSY